MDEQRSTYYEYLKAMKNIYRENMIKELEQKESLTSNQNRKRTIVGKKLPYERPELNQLAVQATMISIIASMVPDEIIYKHSDYSIREYETALMFIDISGFTELCEFYTKAGRGGPSRLTQVLNTYIGAMVQEILTHNGDVLKFSGDAFISMWKKSETLTMQDVVHTAIDCGLIIQRNYGTYVTDVGIELKVKVAISAGPVYFSIIGANNIYQRTFVVVGQPVWDVKRAEYVSMAGDVLTTTAAWMYINEGNYCTEPCGDGLHTKVLGVGSTWKRVEKLQSPSERQKGVSFANASDEDMETINYREFSLRPSVISTIQSTWWPKLRRFMVAPILRAVDNEEPMDFLTEVRRVVVVFLNIITRTVTAETLIKIVDTVYQHVCSVAVKAGGLVNKVSMFDKDMMLLVVFGLRGLKHECETKKALECALQLKEVLTDPNIQSVSIAVTSGTTYCGVVGHMLRREYTVIGSAVNMAARLMMAYINNITCDKETFLRSKLDQAFFRLMDAKPLKGFKKPGPIYEFKKFKWSERDDFISRYPILGRDEEIRKYQRVLNNALRQRKERFIKYRDHQYAVALIGPKGVGTTRLLEECMNITPNIIPVERIDLTPNDQASFQLIHIMTAKALAGQASSSRHAKEIYENKIRRSLNIFSMSAKDIYAINLIFGCRFPLPDGFVCHDDILADHDVKKHIQNICMDNFSSTLWLFAIDDAHIIDDASWRILLVMLDTKTIFVVMTLLDNMLSPKAKQCLSNNMIVKVPVKGIDQRYHAALACQLLDVQAIPVDLEKIIQTASGGFPGWIQNFFITLVQRNELTIVTVSRSEAVRSGAIIPPTLALTQKEDRLSMSREYSDLGEKIDTIDSSSEIAEDFDQSGLKSFILTISSVAISNNNMLVQLGILFTRLIHKGLKVYSTPTQGISPLSQQESTIGNVADNIMNITDSDIIQMAILIEGYHFEHTKLDMTNDAIILKTYDSLSSFEKMIVKCSSVLGDVFSRRMLLHLLQSNSVRNVALALTKLFKIKVLECEGGDFTREPSLVMVNRSLYVPNAKNTPYCYCVGTSKHANCVDLPLFAFCGYMKFRDPLFRTTTYELMTESHKQELHTKALQYLERYTRRCFSCGSGCFVNFLGQRFDDGLLRETKEMRSIREQIVAFSKEKSNIVDYMQREQALEPRARQVDFEVEEALHLGIEDDDISQLQLSGQCLSAIKTVRSFSSLNLKRCECLAILLSSYSQIVEHSRGAGLLEKLVEAYLEYADTNLLISNVPQAIRLLSELEGVVKSEQFRALKVCDISWYEDYQLARIFSLRGACMLESEDYNVARQYLLHAMSLFGDSFPHSKFRVKISNIRASLQQYKDLYMTPSIPETIIVRPEGRFFEDIAATLNRLYGLFYESNEIDKALLTAKRALSYALRTNNNFRLLCTSYGNMLCASILKQDYSKCLKLVRRAIELCDRKYDYLDITEVHSVCYLYVSIFVFYMEFEKKQECLQFGLTVLHMMTSLSDLATRQMLLITMLKLLLSEVRIHDMVIIMKDFLYITYYYDLSSESWYYFYALLILLDTGYCVETYQTCEKFYERRGDAIMRSKTPESAWCFIVAMWSLTIRLGVWEMAIQWDDKIQQIMKTNFENNEYAIMIKVRLAEGFLITLVRELDGRNIKIIMQLLKTIKSLMQDIKMLWPHFPLYKPRYCFLCAYFQYIIGERTKAFKTLNLLIDLSKKHSQVVTVLRWAEHTRDHWNGNLDPSLVNYWVEHIEPNNLLDYRDLSQSEFVKIVPYTLPIPRD